MIGLIANTVNLIKPCVAAAIPTTLVPPALLGQINLVVTFASFSAMLYANFHHLFLDFCRESSSILRQSMMGFFAGQYQ